MNGTFEEDDKSKLNVEQQASLNKLAQHLRDVAQAMSGEPMNPKISDLLHIIADLAEEQVRLDTYYYYHGCEGCGSEVEEKPNESEGYLFFDNKDDCEEIDIKEDDDEKEVKPSEPSQPITPSIADQITQWFDDGMPERKDDD